GPAGCKARRLGKEAWRGSLDPGQMSPYPNRGRGQRTVTKLESWGPVAAANPPVHWLRRHRRTRPSLPEVLFVTVAVPKEWTMPPPNSAELSERGPSRTASPP